MSLFIHPFAHIIGAEPRLDHVFTTSIQEDKNIPSSNPKRYYLPENLEPPIKDFILFVGSLINIREQMFKRHNTPEENIFSDDPADDQAEIDFFKKVLSEANKVVETGDRSRNPNLFRFLEDINFVLLFNYGLKATSLYELEYADVKDTSKIHQTIEETRLAELKYKIGLKISHFFNA